MAKKAATKEEKEYMCRVSELCCSACNVYGVEVHHVRNFTGMGLRPSHYDTIPLCFDCHRGHDGVHLAKKSFEEKYGSQQEMIRKTREILGYEV